MTLDDDGIVAGTGGLDGGAASDSRAAAGTSSAGVSGARDSGADAGPSCDEICSAEGVGCQVEPSQRTECRRLCEGFVANSPSNCVVYRGRALECLEAAIEDCYSVNQCDVHVDRVWFCTHDCMNDGWGFGSLDNVFGYLTERCACAADGAAAGQPCTRPRDCAPHCCCPDKNRIAVRMCIQGRCVDRERACSEVGSCW